MQFYKSVERLDAAGCTLQTIFGLFDDDKGNPYHEPGMAEGDESQPGGQSNEPPLGTGKGKRQEWEMRAMFKNWILNLDVYGSFEPFA